MREFDFIKEKKKNVTSNQGELNELPLASMS